ncbi:MAG: M16 family metallopeptidase, partial [Nitrospirales bacterium]
HFLEHMFFKGTRRRSAMQISREIDGLGGELNAFTTRETTTYYVKVLDQQLKPAVDLLADLFYHSRFDSREVDKEKQVVLEEIRMVQDDPEDFVQDLHTQQTFKDHPVGLPILGDASTIRTIRRDHLIQYIRKHYHPQRTILAVAGNVERRALMALLKRRFGSFATAAGPADPVRRDLYRYPARLCGGLSVRPKPLEQAHLCLSLRGLPLGHKERYAAHALNAVLGGSVSSRLFQEVRERRGLAYSIYSYLASFSDCGTFTIYAATRPREAPRVLEVICRELRRLRTRGPDKTELELAKNQMKGSLMLSLESTHSRMNKLAKDELYQGRHTSLEDMLADIDRVSKDRVMSLSRELFDLDRLAVTALGPISSRSLQNALP